MVGAGLTTIDSADVYAAWVPGHTGGEGETVTGAWLKKRGHRNDETTPLEETLEAFVRLIKPGKVRAIGAPNSSAVRRRTALNTNARHGLPRDDALRPHCNLVERGIEADLIPLCREAGWRSPPTSRSRLDFSRANTAPKPIWRKARGAPAMSAGI